MMQEILSKITWLEWLGVLFSSVQVLLARKNNVNNYLFGIAGVLIALYLKFNAHLYAEFTLELYYLVMSVYGWIFWKYGNQKTEVPVSYSDSSERFKSWGIVVGTFSLFYLFLTIYTKSDVPIWDSAVAAFAWAGMWLLAKRKIENWIFLAVSNIISIPLMIHKDFYLYAVLYTFLLIVAIFGYINWKKIIKGESEKKAKNPSQ